MSFLKTCEETVIGRFLFPFSNTLFNRRGILKRYRDLKRTSDCSSDELHSIQLGLLKEVLKTANEYVPYYTRLFKKIDFEPRDFKEFEDLQLIPPLTREDLIDNRLDLVDTRWRAAAEKANTSNGAPGEPHPLALFRGKQLIRNSSSGSTGQPTIFYETGSITASNWANELRLRSWFNIQPGAREVRIARMSINDFRKSKVIPIRRRLWNQLQLPGASMTDEDYAFTAKEVSGFKPRVLWSNTYSLVGLAEYIKAHPKAYQPLRPELIITWAAPLYDHERVILENVFRCPVSNIYGLREVGHIASQSEHGSMHIHQESVYLESLHNNSSIATNTPSELLATTLVPTPMPFIRYHTGDVGTFSDSECACGMKLKTLKELTGRTGEIFRTDDGRMIPAGLWCHLFMDAKLDSAVRRFQIVYRPENQIVIRIVKGTTYNEGTEPHLKATIQQNIGSTIKLKFEYLETIPAQPSGKRPIILNEAP
ncbi:MAG: phenylacetate--CoA ligase family protein [Opitutaceae bacterium]|nr:phenylacetate--CoA ligase family protein [Opitutaceae bacterium]